MESVMSERDIIVIVLDELKRKNLIHEVKSSFKLTEQALYLVPKIRQAINTNKNEIKYIKEHGMPEKSKSITAIHEGGLILDKQDMLDNKINNLLQANILNNSYINKINNILNNFKDDKYFEIIELKYYKNKTREEIANYFSCDEKTITRNKNRLINEIKTLLFPNNSIDELGY